MLNLLLATVVAFAAVGLLVYLVGLLLRAASLPVDGLWERWRVARAVARARVGDARRERGDLNGALHAYYQAFVLAPIRHRGLASTVANHHTGLLSRFIAVTEEVQGGSVRLLSLAKVDRVLNERSELQRRYANSRQAPAAKHREMRGQLEHNRHELDAALRQLIGEIGASRQPERTH